MTTVNFYTWDYDRQVVETWERSGDCNGCGDCCLGEVTYIFQRRDINEQIDMRETGGGYVLDGTGVWLEAHNGDQRLFRKFSKYEPTSKVCPHLADHKCALHALGKPMLCQLWPISPLEIAAFPRCSYTFRLARSDAIPPPDVLEK